MTTALLVATLAFQAKSITFTHPCASAKVVLAALGDQLGVRMQPGGSVMQDFVILRLNDVPADEALKKISDSLNATWVQQSGTYVLTRTPAQEAKEKADAIATSTREINAWLEKRKVEGLVTLESSRLLIEDAMSLMKANAGESFNEQAWERLSEIDKKSPLSRCLTRLLHEIGAETLASLEPGERVQFVPNPSAKQRKLPQGEALRLFTVENEIHKEALNRSGALERASEGSSMWSSVIQPYSNNYRQDNATALTVTRQQGFFSIRFDLEGVGQVYDSISPDRERPTDVPKALLEQPGNYEPTKVETELGNAAKVIFESNGEAATLSAEAVSALRDPVLNEPLTVFGSKWLLDASTALGKNLVGVVSDDCYLASLFISSQGQLGFAQFWKFLPQMGTGYTVGLDEKWLTLYPKDPIAVRERRIDREDWRRAIARGKPGGTAVLEDYAAFAALGEDEMGVMIATLPAVIMDHGLSIENMQQGNNLEALRIYGRLTALQQKSARNGGAELLLSRMPARMAKPVSSLVYGERSSISLRKPLTWGQADTYEQSSAETEPLRLLSKGYPPASVLRVIVLRKDVIMHDGSESYRPRGITADEIARQIASAEVWPEHSAQLPQRFAVAPAEQLLLEFEFTNVGFMYHRSQFDFAPKEIKFVPLAQLPPAVRAEIEAGLKKYREMYKNARGGGGG